jgi:hypothetical protein
VQSRRRRVIIKALSSSTRAIDFLSGAIVSRRDSSVLLSFVCAFLIAGSASAQNPLPAAAESDQTPSPQVGRVTLPHSGERSGGWVPHGLAPVDQAGSGRRGYVLHGEDSGVAAPGSNRLAIHGVAANNFYREEKEALVVTQRYETHSLALDYRRGFKVGSFPRFEIGGQMQLHQRDNGFMNGFILNVESFWTSLTGYQKSTNELRAQEGLRPPLGTQILRSGSPIYQQYGGGSGFGDIYAMAKVALLDGDPASRAPRVSARLGLNIAGSAPYTEGNFVGGGLSFDQKLSEGVAFHVDVRAARLLDETSAWNLPLRPWTYGFSVGPEFRLPMNSSLNLQIDGGSTPYWPTGTLAFDKGYGDLTFGLNRRFGPVSAQLYVRENMNLPFRVRWNTDPDMSVGLKIRIH